MRCDTTPPPCDCGSDVHARSMDVCLVRHDGAMLRHRNMQAAPAPLRQAGAPSRDGWVVAVEGLFTWDGLADLGAAAGLPGVLGPALSRPAMHGGQATNDKSDSPKSAALLRGGLRPPASVSPAERRATRALRRRRPHLLRTRAERCAPVHKTNSQDTRPALGTQMASQAHRAGGAARCAEAAVPKPMAVARARLTSDAQRWNDRALLIRTTAPHHEAQPLSR